MWLACKAAALPCRALSSKVVSQYSSLLSPMAVESVLAVLDPARPNTCAARVPPQLIVCSRQRCCRPEQLTVLSAGLI